MNRMAQQSDVLSVKDLTRIIKSHFEKHPQFQNLWVRAEISNFTHHSRGHMYFTLKDEHSRIKAVMFAGHNRYLKFLPRSGMKVLARGEVNVYERDGQYQFYVKEMQPDGIGALYQAFEELKNKLEQRGWFDEKKKKPIPKIPRKIGVVTSGTGAAIRDIFTTLSRRFPTIEIVLLPVLVQGDRAPQSISKAIDMAHQLGDLDLLIVGRGGGSIEELWAFNEEIVAEAIHRSTIPIISAVGHETDFTMADFVADLRAPTPTAAAELAVPMLTELVERINNDQLALRKALLRITETKKREINQLRNRYAFKYPQQLVKQKEQELDQLMERLEKSMRHQLQHRLERYTQIHRQLKRANPIRTIQRSKEVHQQFKQALQKEAKRLLQTQREKVHHMMNQLDAYSPLKIMTKGYSLLYNQDRTQLYRSVKEIEPGQPLTIRMHDGELDCQIWGIKEEEK